MHIFPGRCLAFILVALVAGSAEGHSLPNLGMFEFHRHFQVTSSSLVIEHTARLRPGVLENRATARVLDEDSNGEVSDKELGGFLQYTANHLAEDFVVLASRRGPGETSDSMAAEPLPNQVQSYSTLRPITSSTTSSLGQGFRQVLRIKLPDYLTRPIQPNSDPQASLVLETVDPCFLVQIQGLADLPADADQTTGSLLTLQDPAITVDPPPGPVPHELFLRLTLANPASPPAKPKP